MNGYYKVTEKLYELLKADPDVNTITKGSAEEIDTYKAAMFPLVHILPVQSPFTTNTTTFTFVITALNQRETYQEPTDKKYIKNDNEDDNLNAMYYVLLRLYLQLRKFGEEFDVINEPIPEPKLYEFSNLLDGWEATFEIQVPIEEITAC